MSDDWMQLKKRKERDSEDDSRVKKRSKTNKQNKKDLPQNQKWQSAERS